jgi:hypothetical protein
MVVLAATEPSIGGFAWGVHYPIRRALQVAGASVILLAYTLVLLALSWESMRVARILLVWIGAATSAFGVFALLWAIFFLFQGAVPYLFLFIWASCVLYVQYLGLSAARRLRA